MPLLSTRYQKQKCAILAVDFDGSTAELHAIFLCTECGAVVWDREAHDAAHAAERFARMQSASLDDTP